MIQSPELALIEDRIMTIKEHHIAARIYHSNPEKALSTLLHFHGVSHMCGIIGLYHLISRELAIAINAIVICIDGNSTRAPLPLWFRRMSVFVKAPHATKKSRP
jgi:acetyl esterase